ncbi:hypothetical protein FBU59_002683 [Linderina macrospora]|uniref:Uncharacterized protein n=1 Tax=Linderina macrospora TaxID=4868 RepID=A0ACC1JAM2_9FUNG|nr:hypothetical protein FBU59_002683 [Linderina macrospora]
MPVVQCPLLRLPLQSRQALVVGTCFPGPSLRPPPWLLCLRLPRPPIARLRR